MLEKYALLCALKRILAEPQRSFTVRELARCAKLSPASAGICLHYMKRKGIVSLKRIGKACQYLANLESPLCRQWKVLFNLDSLEENRVVHELMQAFAEAHSILLYGSLAKGTEDRRSDMDILIVVPSGAKIAQDMGRNAKRELNITVFSMDEWKEKARKDKVFYENVMYNCIVLKGELPVVL